MRKVIIISLCIWLSWILSGAASARDNNNDKQVVRESRGIKPLFDTAVPGAYRGIAQPDTYNIVRYDFEAGDWQGWASVDNTAQVDIFWHATCFDGDPDPSGGWYIPINGSVSMWCGAPAGNSYYLCGWDAAPGYGNNWKQFLVSDQVDMTTAVALRISFDMIHCVEGYGYDQIYLEYENDAGGWVVVETFGSGSCRTVDYDNVIINQGDITDGDTRIRFRMVSDNAWSDEDGLFDSSGACILDDITLSTTDVNQVPVWSDTEDFEGASDGDKSVGIWTAAIDPGYVESHQTYSGPSLYSGMSETDPCTSNFEYQAVFFEGSGEAADQDKYPFLYVTPRCLNGGGTKPPCQNEMIISPLIDMMKYSTGNNNIQDGSIPSGELPNLSGVLFRFTVLADLPMDNLVFYTWKVRNVIIGCPEEWVDEGMIYYGPNEPYYQFSANDISDMVFHPDTTLQVSLGIIDMCEIWNGYYGYCTNHTPCPWFDNIQIQRVNKYGPQWSYRGFDLFQDTFPHQSETVSDTCRADIALDITDPDNTVKIVRGDSAVIEVTSPIAGGLGTANGRAEVYIHVRATNPQDATSLAGAQLVGANDTWMTYISDDGTWTKLQGDTARLGGHGFRDIATDNYMFDLNDSLFTRGYIVEYYFSAVDANGASGTLPTNADEGGAFEFTCLPLDSEVDVLFVDDFDGRGSWDGLVQDYWDPTFAAVMAGDVPERYDVNSPSSAVGNGLESCIDAADLGLYYHTIIWDCGDLSTATIGMNTQEETNDVQLLEDWFTDIHNHYHKANLLVMGTSLMSDLDAGEAVSFQANVLGADLDGGSYIDCTGGIFGGGITYPRLIASSGGCMEGLEEFCIDGGCPVIQRFDMLSLLGTTSSYALEYEQDCEGETKYAAVCNDDTTNNGLPARAVTCAFSMMQVLDCDDEGPLVRHEFFEKVLEYFTEGVNSDITGETPGGKHATRLYRNYPNPFNPSTEIKFSLKKRSKVTIRVYDVSGRIVNTLVNCVLGEGAHSVRWNGINSNGVNLASGVYFYRMDTGDYTESRKMILLR